MTATVRDHGLTGADSRRAVDLGLIEAEWFRPPIGPDRLRALQVRTNDLSTGEALRFPATEPITLYDVALRNGRVVSRLAPRQAGTR